MIWLFLIVVALLALYLSRPTLAKVLGGFLLCLLLAVYAVDSFYYLTHRERFIDEKELTILSKAQSATNPVLYASDNTSFYLLTIDSYYKIDRKNTCADFEPENRSTWCGEAGFFSHCYPTDTVECKIFARNN